MKSCHFSHPLVLALGLALLPLAGASGVTFSSNTLISPNNTNFDGADIVVTNCTVTVDGAHSFASFQVQNGGVLTHSFAASGSLNLTNIISNESQILVLTNPVTLSATNVVDGTVVVTDSSGLVTYTNGVDYLLTGTGLVMLQRTATSNIPDGATVLVSYTITYGVPTGLNLAIAGDFSVNVGGAVDADALGYGGGMGPGAGHNSTGIATDGSGGGYGGFGGMSSSNAPGGLDYGSALQPVDKGSGGGTGLGGLGGIGGGMVSLVIGGNLRVDGVISADGQNATNSRSGGGAGGGIYLTAQNFSGSGWISVDGGAGEPIHGGGGGGGRIAIYCSSKVYTGVFSAKGGQGFVIGGAGTLYTETTIPQAKLMVLDNGGRSGANSVLAVSNGADVILQGNAIATAYYSPPIQIGSLLVSSNSWLVPPNALVPEIILHAAGNVVFQAGGGIRADGFTNSAPSPFKGNTTNAVGSVGYVGSGGGHGAAGGAGGIGPAGGVPYGGLSGLPDLGAGGGYGGGLVGPKAGGFGGAAVMLTVTGTLEVDGQISANGVVSPVIHGGGGSGGGLLIQATTLTGTGTISANGGAGVGLGGGGAGGRISLIYLTNAFQGRVTAYGGGGAKWGGAGTIAWSASLPLGPTLLRVDVDNGGTVGAPTTFGGTLGNYVTLNVVGGASAVLPTSSATLVNLLIGSGSLLYMTNPALTAITINSNATIQAGGSILLDGAGYTPGQGLGSGANAGTIGVGAGGGGYGGFGATGAGGAPGIAGPGRGGNGYGSVTEPTDRGSAGGNPLSVANAAGGLGGGAVRFTISNTLQLDGVISANGFPGTGTNAGGGSGGSILITANTLAGAGLMRANGGNGVNLGGGGGGGRITVLSQTNQFSGSMTAYGGGGAAYGGAGTIYLGSSSYGKPSTNQLIIDNGGRSGTNTSLGTTQFGTIDLDLINGAVLGLRGPLLLDNLLIGSNSWLYVTNTTLGAMVATLTVAGNAQIQAGGGIIADATGPFGGQGEGPGRLATTPGAGSSGGGNGGYGASTTVPGGPAYGNATGGTSPVGSGGGNAYPTQTGGGSGGGAVQMTVTGLLQVDGRISADGGSGFVQQAGGGSGGGILLTVGGLTGTGLISASGGPGAGLGGGGGGGRVTVAYRSNYFTGTLKATGAGSGTNFGGAGTIYTRLLTQQSGQLMADNGGNPGSLTLVPDASVSSLVVQGGASVVTTYRNFTMASLLVGTNSWIVASNRSEIDVTGVATIQMGGGLMGDGRGYLAQGGPGAGYSSTQVAGGGGYGGNGGANPLSTGNSYGSMIGENQIGSGGGSLTNVKPTGGAGGGYVAFGGFGTLILNGIISDNGMGGSQNGAGGSGGSVYLNVSTLAGSGQIMANGGAGDPLANAGGGGGGRIALYYRTNTFAGSVVAKGGAGTVAGGAGTIYWHLVGQPSGSVLVDNAGQVGASTPVKNIGAFDLTVSGGAVAYPASSFLILSNLLVSSGAMMTSGPGQTNLQLSILSNLVVDADSGVVVDGMGFSQALGPGAGQSAYGDGSGAGYGGFGGDSMTAPGGISYGSATIPVDLGSGGGFGSGPTYVGGSAGGGAIHLDIGGNLTVNGWLSANGNPGLQDNSGGGSGGSVWVNSRALYGYGYVLADGGDGELYGGGGGSGGRIAIYHLRNTIHTNTFTGTIAAYGGQGDSWGDDGSIFLASTSGGLRVLGQTPVGATEASVGAMTVTFDGAVNPFSAANANVTLTTPVGVLTSNSLAFSLADPYTLIISFSQQSAPGLYTLYLGPQITDLFGQPLAQAYTGTFSIVLPSVSGTVTDTNGNPVAGVLMQPDGPWSSSTTDNQGKYSISVVSGTFLTVTPSYTNNMFLPKARTYSGVTGSVTNENYTMVSTIAPYLQVGRQDGNLTLGWYGLLGVSYYVQSSTNLVNWVQDGYPVLGTNGVMVVPLPIGTDPNTFFRIQAFN